MYTDNNNNVKQSGADQQKEKPAWAACQ